MREFLAMTCAAQWQPLCALDFFSFHRMCPRVAKPETSGKFFGSNFGGCFNDRSQRITVDASVFTVRVVNAPKLISRLLRRILGRVHAGSEHDAASRQVRIAHFLLHVVRCRISREVNGSGQPNAKWMIRESVLGEACSASTLAEGFYGNLNAHVAG